MASILQGTTPSIRYPFKTTDLDVSNVIGVEFSIKHKDVLQIHGLDDVIVDTTANTITYHFSQEETLAMDPGDYVYYQIRCKLTDNNTVGTVKEKAKVADLMSKETL